MSSNGKTEYPSGAQILRGDHPTTTKLTLYHYDRDNNFTENHYFTISSSLPEDGVNWLKVDGLGDTALIEKFSDRFNFHPLIIEDILNTNHRPKHDDSDGKLFVTIKRIMLDSHDRPQYRQVSLLLFGNTVISFHEVNDGVLDPLLERIRKGLGKVREMGADYLLYTILDFIVDHYYITLEKMGEQIEVIEHEISSNPSELLLHRTHKLKRDLLKIRKATWPLRELASTLIRDDGEFFSRECRPYLRDLYDHAIQTIDTIDGQRDVSSGLLDLYMSGISNRMNSIMQTLTIVSTIFIPLTFIAGIYGMNFENIPETKLAFGYPMILGVMLIIAICMLRFFKKKKWL
ncbi:MAG: magnesium/cobalt transporter CorA [Planctomycetes bacterium]|nr:magnesium/cobalt transporter CorA [Planctomycetota bacterium]